MKILFKHRRHRPGNGRPREKRQAIKHRLRVTVTKLSVPEPALRAADPDP